MSRLANQIAMGFFPTDNKAVEAILDSLSSKQIPSDFNVCDPCCGEGEALSRFKRFAGVTTYGVELDEERAKKAFEKLDNLISVFYKIHSDMFLLHSSKELVNNVSKN